MIWAYLLGAILSEFTGTMLLRASEGFRKKRYLVPVTAAYALSFTLLSFALAAGMPVGIAYGIWAALGVALTALGARVFFKEKLTPRMVVGLVCIAAGVLVIEMSSGH